MNPPERLAVAFCRQLRLHGLAVGVDGAVVYAEALGAVGLGEGSKVYWAGRAALVHRPEEIAIYDEVFVAFWAGTASTPSPEVSDGMVAAVLDGGEFGTHAAEGATVVSQTVAVRWSPAEILRHKDFARYSETERAEARRLMGDLRLVGELRSSRRRRRASHAGTPDVRRTVRAAVRTGGDPLRRHWRARSQRPRRVVLLLDISGSMEPYARALLRFVHAAVAGGRVEAFALGTRLTRLARELSSSDPDAAVARAARSVEDWSGGTRLGAALGAFNDGWGARGMARGATVVVLSDGWDRGDTAQLAAEMARLRRLAHRVVWVNPLKAAPGYAPLAAGMAAALPHVDDFVEGHSLAALSALVQVINRRGRAGGRRG